MVEDSNDGVYARDGNAAAALSKCPARREHVITFLRPAIYCAAVQ